MSELTWDEELVLIGSESCVVDELGQQIPEETRTTVCCCRKPTPRQEIYFAGQIGIKISETLIVHPYEYNGETAVEISGQRLYILKTYQISLEELELTCTEKIGGNGG